MKIDTDIGLLEGPEPAGPEGRALRAAALPVIAATEGLVLLGRGAQLDPGTRAGMISTWCARIEGHPAGLPLLLQTFAGWTLDGQPFDRDRIARLPLGDAGEPWAALFEVWLRIGFFGRQYATAVAVAEAQAAKVKREAEEAAKAAEEAATNTSG